MGNLISFDDYCGDVVEWAKEKGLLKYENHPKQFMKLVEELGEVSSEVNKKGNNIAGELGDLFVTAIILSKQLGYEPSECLRQAYNKIKDRKGSMVNGVFVKEEDWS
jgi:NTP pyrophosphatase (non-canonical NTP hydrolase)